MPRFHCLARGRSRSTFLESMIYLDGTYRLSATDLAAHLGCHHLTQLGVRAARRELKRPQYYDPHHH
jgi:hypothetical protein